MPIWDETRMTLKEASVLCNRDRQTIRAWIKTGVRGVRLEAIKFGHSVLTSREAIERFISAMNAVKGA